MTQEHANELIERCEYDHTTLGGYPIVAITQDVGILCPSCVRQNRGLILDHMMRHDDKAWRIVWVEVHWEGPPLECDHCGKLIESAYGTPD